MPSTASRTPAQAIFRPSLFIGLGSTGAKIVSRLKRLIDAEGDPWTSRFYRYLRITSEIEPEEGVDPNIDSITLSGRKLAPSTAIESLLKSGGEEADAHFKKWWHTDPGDRSRPWCPLVDSLEEGSGGIRACGRLLLHYKCLDAHQGNLANRIAAVKDQLLDARNKLQVHEQPMVDIDNLQCYLFGLLAGGTCSGTYLDVAFLIRQAIPGTRIFGTFLLDDICYNQRTDRRDPVRMLTQKYNGWYALAEMVLVHSMKGFRIVSKDWVREIGRTARLEKRVFRTPPFFRIALIGAKNDDNRDLPNFDEYMEFVAQYYAGLFANGLNVREIARYVDDEAANRTTRDTEYPARANNIERLGLLRLRVPREKILAMASEEVARAIGLRHFKNANDEFQNQERERFLTAISWSDIHKQFVPPDDAILEEEFELPDSGEEFVSQWDQRKKDIDAYYSRWQGKGIELESRLNAFKSRWDTAIKDMLARVLGQVHGYSLSIGDLKAVLKTVVSDLDSKSRELEAETLALRASLYADKKGSLEKRFENTLKQAKKDYPTAMIRRLRKVFKAFGLIGTWYGLQNTMELLRDYRDSLRELVYKEAVQQALTSLRSELIAVSVVRELIAGESAWPIIESTSQRTNQLFEEKGGHEGIGQSVLEKRGQINDHLVKPLLAMINPRGGPSTLGDAARSDIVNRWQSSIQPSFNTLLELVRDRHDRMTSDHAKDSEDIRRALDALRNAFGKHLKEVVESVVSPAVDEITVWNAIERYVRATGEDAEWVVRNMFKTFASQARLFSKLGDNAGKDPFQLGTRRLYYICDEQAAADCFSRLGMNNSNIFLGDLLQNLFGERPLPMVSLKATKNEMWMFFAEVGRDPAYFQGYSAVGELLVKAKLRDLTESTNWSDKRFPKWIQSFNANRPKPRYLE